MRVKLLFTLLLLPVAALAGDFTSTGAGGGGWLHSGAFLPTDSTVIVVGADVSGPYRTDNFGTAWYPWTAGLLNSDRLYTDYVMDLLGIDYGDWTGFFAATHGGIYFADENGDWEPMTPVSVYGYQKNPGGNRVYPFPFSCLDWRGDSLMVAGSGRTWWNSDYQVSLDYELGDYPPIASYSSYGEVYDGQWTVWTLDLDEGGSATWEPDEDSEFGAARDISLAVIDDTTYIAVATADGIHLRGPGGWTTIFDSTDCGGCLACWTLHLTKRGTLYAAMRKTDSECSYPYGAYRLFDVTNPGGWTWVGDEVDLPPESMSVKDYGSAHHNLIMISARDGEGTDPDLLFLGGRNSGAGLFRGTQPYDVDSLCHWEHKVYGAADTLCYWDNDGDKHDLDTGWHMGPAGLIFPVAVSDSFPKAALLHLGGKLYTTDDAMDSWDQCYTEEGPSDFWLSTGYEELGAAGLAFMSDRRLVQSTIDHGLFRSYDDDLDAFEYLAPPEGDPSPSNTVPYNPQTWTIEVRPDWPDSGSEAIVFIAGDLRASPSKLMWIDENDTWYNMTRDLLSDEYRFYDFVFTDDDTCFISYAKYDDEVGTPDADFEEYGVLRGRYNHQLEEWLWSTWNCGLQTDSSLADSYAHGADLLYHEATGRIFMAAEGMNAMFPEDTTWIPGGIYILPSSADTAWQFQFDGDSTDYQCFTCLAQSSDGDVVYAGARGSLWASKGNIFKCTNPEDSVTIWTEMANTGPTDLPFEFGIPEGTGWDSTTANQYLTSVSCLAVNPWLDNVVFAGFKCDGFAEQDGLWKYTPAGGWQKMSDGEDFDGWNIGALAIKARPRTAKLVVGTRGLGLFHTTLLRPIEPDGPAESGQERKISSGLKLVDIRTEVGGRAEINFTLEHPSPVKMKVYDVAGRLVHHHQADFAAGRASLVWDGSSRRGRPCASGIYFLRLSARDVKADKKFLLVR